MVKHMSYSTISCVIESWDLARRNPGSDETIGIMALQKLFELEPRSKTVFGFAPDFEPTDEALKVSGRLVHALRVIDMIDAALSMLGPDTEVLDEVLTDLGKRHIKYGVSAHYFPFFGQAITHSLERFLGDGWTPEISAAWSEVYEELSGHIMKTIMNNT